MFYQLNNQYDVKQQHSPLNSLHYESLTVWLSYSHKLNMALARLIVLKDLQEQYGLAAMHK